MIDPEATDRGTDNPSPAAPFYCGVDVGASSTKVVLIDGQSKVLARYARKSGVDYKGSARESLEQALDGIPHTEKDLACCVATGYGRDNVDFAHKRVTEITCHGMGCYHCAGDRGEIKGDGGQGGGRTQADTEKNNTPKADSGKDNETRDIIIVDIGGQDSKVIRLDHEGNRRDFKMNRKCAAGTGAFLEEIAARLDLPLGQMNKLAGEADKVFTLGSFCTVFAKTEILACIRKGERVENILRGAFQSVVNRIVEMDRFRDGEVVLTGGVVQYNPILAKILGETLEREVTVPPHPQFTGALGAALLAREEGGQ